MADKKISQLDSTSSVNSDAVFPLSQTESGSLKTVKGTVEQIGDYIAKTQDHSTLNTTSKKLVGAINEKTSLIVTTPISASSSYDFTNFSDGAVVFVYRPSDAGQSDYTGIYIRASNWARLIPIKEAPNVTVSGYVLTNNNTQGLRCVVLST